MTDSQEMTAGSKSIVCGEYLDISHIGQLSDDLKGGLESSEPILFIDGEKVERVDAASLQLLAAFFKDAKSQGMALQWRKPSDALRNASRVMGLSNLLDLGAE